MYSIRSDDDLSKLVHLARKKNILARFVMNGCQYCVNSQPEWNDFTSKYSGDLALAEIESSYLQHFQKMMAPRSDPIPVKGYPSIIMIRDSKVSIVPSLNVIQRKKTKKTKKTKKSKKTKKNKA